MDLHEKLLEVSRLFRIDYEYLGYETIQMGNVNRTYKVNFMLPEGKPKSFLVQNVNTYAFRNPVGLMDNIDKVTEHIRAKKPGQLALHFHHTADRKTYVVDGSNFWRMTNYVPSVTFNAVTDLDILRNAGRAFGEFQMDLADFEIDQLIETIPGFHNTRQRYEKFIQAVQENKAGRADEVREEIDFLLSVQDMACRLTDLQMAGQLPLRVTHNDTKINNILLDRETRKGCVIDLDTVMPGLVAFDFGDAIRIAASTGEEDEQDLEKVAVDMEKYEEAIEYLEKASKIGTYFCDEKYFSRIILGNKNTLKSSALFLCVFPNKTVQGTAVLPGIWGRTACLIRPILSNLDRISEETK